MASLKIIPMQAHRVRLKQAAGSHIDDSNPEIICSKRRNALGILQAINTSEVQGNCSLGWLEPDCPILKLPCGCASLETYLGRWLGTQRLITQDWLCRRMGGIRRQITVVTNLRDSIFWSRRHSAF